MEINVPIQLPGEFEEKLLEQFEQIALKALKKAEVVNELPLYATKTEVRKTLNIGNDKLSSWIAQGLQLTKFSEKDYRIARQDLKDFFDQRKI
ncbi:hypothetical protein ACFFIF_01765 [Vagococcus entomophilus]|uniref:DNA-binding protein n=1 Tax=Vagococcus entomophilus TaxID=1160095 RepID=A0A430AK39_9ENTE|nr:hypothetical protein [Vagococcus entomophilus]RSU08470.1 hypothetical protein CBF30_04315 [Vagococcus entomophilus]